MVFNRSMVGLKWDLSMVGPKWDLSMVGPKWDLPMVFRFRMGPETGALHISAVWVLLFVI